MRYTTTQIKDGTGFERGSEWVSAKWADELLAALERIADACEGQTADFEGGWVKAHEKIGAYARAAIAKDRGEG